MSHRFDLHTHSDHSDGTYAPAEIVRFAARGHIDLLALTEEPVYTEEAQFSRVQAYQRKVILNKSARVCLYGDRITVDDRVFSFDEASAVVILGKNKVNIYFGNEIFQLKGCKRFNGLKYVNFYHRYRNIKGGKNDEFLGI